METTEKADQLPVVHMPVAGTWQLVRSPGHEAFAFDLAAADPRSKKTLRKSRLSHLLGRARVDDSYSWAQPVFAPIQGTVAVASDGWPDRRSLHLLKDIGAMIFSRPEHDPNNIRPFAGNHVIIQGDGFYVFLAHLQEGSLTVSAGEEVSVGQPIGRVGNSGFTLEPHLHLQLFDQIDDLESARAPAFVVAEYERWTEGAWTSLANAPLEKGAFVRFAGY